jgi:hypothetical protein
MCAYPHLAGRAVLKVPPGFLQVIAIGALVRFAIRSRLEKLVDLVAIEM